LPRAWLRGFGNLKLHLERSKLAYPEALVALRDLLPLSDVAAYNGSRERGTQSRLVDFDFDPVDIRLAALRHCFPTVHVELGGFRLKIGCFEICLAGKPRSTQLLLALQRRVFRLQFRFFVFNIVLRDR
jgi:hypothetical protein